MRDLTKVAAFVAATLLASWGHAQASQTTQRESERAAALALFEVVSIKTHPPGYWPVGEQRRFTSDGFLWKSTTAQDLLVYAYNLQDPEAPS